MKITLEPGYDDRAELEQLFDEYMAMLLSRQPEFRAYLEQQHYDTELEHLREKYGPPEGRLYLARADGTAAGCVALRRIDQERCELKRLYVRPAYRGHGLAGRLVDQVLGRCPGDWIPGSAAGYLSLSGGMPSRLYKKRAFREVPSYNGTPMEQLIYLRLDLKEQA